MNYNDDIDAKKILLSEWLGEEIKPVIIEGETKNSLAMSKSELSTAFTKLVYPNVVSSY